MALYKTKAVVLRSQDLGEADRLIVFYSEKAGKIKAVAKGLRRTSSKFGARLEVFTFLDLILYEKGEAPLEIITQAQIITSFKEIRQDLRRIAYGSYLVELTESLLSEKEPDNRLLSLILQSLHWLRLEVNPLLPPFFTLRILSLLGYEPHLSCCLICHQEPGKGMRFSVHRGGIICPDCRIDEETGQISSSALSLMRRLLGLDLRQIRGLSIPNSLIDELTSWLFKNYLPYYLSRPLKSVKFLEGESKCVV